MGRIVSDQISMGAVRLKIIDLEGGQQPMQSEDGQTILAYNGEIYNYKEIRQILIGRGHRFSSNSDTEVVLHAFLEWDTGCFEKLKGMFAIALWQDARRPADSGARPNGDQAALFFDPARRDLFWIGNEGPVRPSSDITNARFSCARPVPIPELRPWPSDLGRGHRKTATRPLLGMGRRRIQNPCLIGI